MRLGMIAVRLGLVIALLAGCSDSGESHGSKDTTTTSGEGSETPSVDDPRTGAEWAADQAAAEGIVLTLDDFEPGWASSPPTERDDANDKKLIADLADCLGVDPGRIDLDNNPTDTPPNFVSPSNEQVSASVSYLSSVEVAERDFDEIYRNEDMPSCFSKSLRAAIMYGLEHPEERPEPADDLVIGEFTFSPVSFAELGDEMVAYRATIPLSASGNDIEIYMDFLTVRVGRVLIGGLFERRYSQFSTDEAERLLGVMVDRVPADADA